MNEYAVIQSVSAQVQLKSAKSMGKRFTAPCRECCKRRFNNVVKVGWEQVYRLSCTP